MPKTAVKAAIIAHASVTDDIKKLVVYAPAIAAACASGQFVHVKITDGEPLLRRPISIANADKESGTLTLLYRIVGTGTAALAELPVGAVIDCMGPLGRGFDLNCRKPLLIGGGIGIAPLIFLHRQLKEAGAAVSVLLGGRNKQEMFWPALFDDAATDVHVTTDDGSMGFKGFTVGLLPQLLQQHDYDRVFVCGPQVMMQAAADIAREHGVACQVSLEKHMACGIGACLSCTCQGKDNTRKKVCSDGPVFWAEEVL